MLGQIKQAKNKLYSEDYTQPRTQPIQPSLATGMAGGAPLGQKSINPTPAKPPMQPMAQTLAPGAGSLADQLRAQNTEIDWNIKGIDRAQELADYLQKRGVTDISNATFKRDGQYTIPGYWGGGAAMNEGGGETSEWVPEAVKNDGGYIDFGNGVKTGYRRDINNFVDDIEYIKPDQTRIGSSFKGKGNVRYKFQEGPDGRAQIVPSWASSSDMGKVRDAIKIATVVAGGFGLAGMGPLGGLGNALGTAGGGAAAGAADIGALGLAEGVYGAGGALGAGAAPGTVGGLAGSTAGFGGLGSVLPSSVGFAAPGALGAGAAMDLSTVGGPDPAGIVPNTAPPAAPPYTTAAADSQLASSQLGITGGQAAPAAAGGAAPAVGNGAFLGEGVASGIPAWDASVGLAGAGGATPGVFNAAMDSQAANVAGVAGTQPPLPISPSSVNLGSSGNYATGGGMVNNIANALEAAKVNPAGTLASAGSSVLDFAKKNPQLAALGASGLAQLAGGSPDLPKLPGSGGGAGGAGGVNTPLAGALEQQIGGMGAPDYSGVFGLKNTAGDPNTLNQEAIDAAYSQQTRMLDPQFAREKQAMEARLAEQGFVPGTPGYERAMSIFGEERTKAYGSARDSSIMQGYQIGQGDFRNRLSDTELNNSASRESLAQILAKRNQPFNELASIKGNQQIDYNNQLDRYNAEVSSSNSRNQALSQLALALGMYLG